MSTADRGDQGFRVHAPGDGVPEVSILVPTCEQEEYVGVAIESVLAQRDITAEIIVSDDASTDRTWERITDTLASAPTHPHRVILRRGTTRLRRDHMALLVERSSAEIVMAAHGDDISAPDRSRRLVDVLEGSGAVLTGSSYTTIDEHGRPTLGIREPSGSTRTGELLGPEELVSWRDDQIGSLVAWRPSALSGFERLDQRFAPRSHDRILPFRAALAGGVTTVREPLVQRRRHPGNWSRRITDKRSPDAAQFAGALARLSALRAMRLDLLRAQELHLLDEPRAAVLSTLLDEAWADALDSMMVAHHSLVVDGRAPLWVTEHELSLALQGSLTSVLARRARLQRPVAGLLSITRALRSRRRHLRR